MRKEGRCMHCMLEKRPYLHNIYYKNSVLEFCTSCVLKLNPGKFCPLCFSVYENEDPNSNPPAVCCSMCSAIAHFDCVMNTSASSSSSSYDPTANFACRSCSDPEFQFFDWKEGGRIDLRGMDMGLAEQLVAASFISGRSMKDGADLCRQKAEVKAEQAALARKEATKALELLAELTAPDPVPESSDVEGDDEQEYTSNEYEYEYSDVEECSDGDDECSDGDDEYSDEGDEDETTDDYENTDEEEYGAEDERSDEEEPGDVDEDDRGVHEDDNNEEEEVGGDEEANSKEDSSGKPSG